MIRFHTLGVLDLKDHQGCEIRSVLQQPKRLGLLAYLVVASPRRFHRRDSLLALFWPDLDQDHARAALRRALYFLRTELGAEVIAGRGDDEVGVNEDTLWCDAPALDRAVEEGAPERALSLYRGPLLDGLYVSGAAPEYQEWLDRERGRLRSRAAVAAKMLSGQAASEGRLHDAAGWARRMLELAPDDEATLRRLVDLLDQSGDRAGALQAYEDFARRLTQEYELQPSGETRAAVDAIRARPGSDARPLPPVAPFTIAVLPFADPGRSPLRLSQPGNGGPACHQAGWRRRSADGGSAGTAPFRGAGTGAGSDPPGPDEGRAVAQHFGAGRYLLGAIVEAGGRIGSRRVALRPRGLPDRERAGHGGERGRGVRAGRRACPADPRQPARRDEHPAGTARGAHHPLARRPQSLSHRGARAA